MENLQWIANFGFAAIVAMYVLWRIEPALDRLGKSIRLLTVVVARGNGQDLEEVEREFVANGGR